MTPADPTRPPLAAPSEVGPDAMPQRSARILKTDASWNGARYDRYPDGVPQLTVVRYSLPAHSSLPWHEHPMPSTAYVLSGSIVLTSIEGVRRVFRAGDAFAESVGNEHRGHTEEEAAEIVCTYAGAEGLPLSVSTGRVLDQPL